ncbi:FAS1-like dehydratase domain-containing protein [Gordonia caeni]|uniref:Mesaconyl-C(4)-CoA hydratase n=1 Tax=Gordonia caeni TaxID=1007097 RepID=A0ABP7NL61_9ACTN
MSWEPRTETTEEYLDPGPVAALTALFDDGLPAPAPGERLPPLWHWAALARWPVSSLLAADGHPAKGDFLPPVELPRRMFAGGSASFPGALRVGDTIRRVARVESVTEKQGRSGALVLVVVGVELYASDGSLAVTERQNLIYREAPAPVAVADVPAPGPVATLSPGGPPLMPDGADRWRLVTDPSLLMRFSAATANAHRIHYDWPYATRVEGYPGLVVHGPLMTLSLAETHRLSGTGQAVRSLSHRNSAPLFCADPAYLAATATPSGKTVEVMSADPTAPGASRVHSTLELTFD